LTDLLGDDLCLILPLKHRLFDNVFLLPNYCCKNSDGATSAMCNAWWLVGRKIDAIKYSFSSIIYFLPLSSRFRNQSLRANPIINVVVVVIIDATTTTLSNSNIYVSAKIEAPRSSNFAREILTSLQSSEN
jgi:hypothetical protein